MIRVVQVSCHLDPLVRVPVDLLAAWPTLGHVAAATARAGLDVYVVQAAAVDARVDVDGAVVHFVAEPKESDFRRRFGLWSRPIRRNVVRRVAGLAPDVIHLHGLAFPLHARALARGVAQARLLVQDHADGVPSPWLRPVYRWGLAVIDGVALTAREQAAPFLESGVLRPGVSVFEVLESSSTFTPGDQGAARARTGLAGDPCLLWLGHLNRNKDPLTVLEALRRGVPELDDPHLWVCYRTAPLLPDVKRRIADDPVLRQRVHLLGSRSHAEVEYLLRAADFLVQGSHREGSGYAVIEALACGTTPLVTDIPSFRKITGNGAVGALSPPGDAAAMAAALVEWSRRDRARLRAQARAHFERELSFNAIGRQLRAAYESLAARR